MNKSYQQPVMLEKKLRSLEEEIASLKEGDFTHNFDGMINLMLEVVKDADDVLKLIREGKEAA